MKLNPEGFEILFEEGPCMVVCKPGGVLTQAVRGIDSLEVRIKQFIKQRDGKPGNVYLGMPHRLDRPVSGVLVVARHVRATRRIAEQFEDRRVKKRYWAVVEGVIERDAGTWTDYLRKIPEQPRAEVTSQGQPGARHAVLHFRVVHRLESATWLEIELETGRMHQIRIQAAARGFPIIGDHQYGAKQAFGPHSENFRDRWIALHAVSLRFRHPMTREVMVVAKEPLAPWATLGLPSELVKKQLKD